MLIIQALNLVADIGLHPIEFVCVTSSFDCTRMCRLHLVGALEVASLLSIVIPVVQLHANAVIMSNKRDAVLPRTRREVAVPSLPTAVLPAAVPVVTQYAGVSAGAGYVVDYGYDQMDRVM